MTHSPVADPPVQVAEAAWTLTAPGGAIHLMGVDPQVLSTSAAVSVQALFFAAYRDLLGTGSLSVDLPPGATVADLVSMLRSRGAPFSALPAEPAVAVNRAYALPSETLHPGDEVAFIPPVAGG